MGRPFDYISEAAHDMIKFSFFGVKFEFSFLSICLISFLLAKDSTGLVSWGIFSAIFHEVFHFIFLLFFSSKPKYVKFGLFGFSIGASYLLPALKEVIVLVSGCIGNLVLLIFCIKFNIYTGAVANVCLLVFNMFPYEWLDGGQLFLIFLERALKIKNSYAILKLVSLIFSILLLILSTISLIIFQNLTVFFVLGMLIFCYLT